MMKKVWPVLLAVVLVFGLVLGCDDGGGKKKKPVDPEDPKGEVLDRTIDLPLDFPIVNNDTQKGWCTNGVDDIETELMIGDLKAAKYLVLELDKTPKGGMQFIWLGDGNNWGWSAGQEVILKDNGDPDEKKGTKFRDNEKKVLEIELSKAVKEYKKFVSVASTKVKIIIGYYSSNIADLGITKAYLEIYKGGDEKKPTVDEVKVTPPTVTVKKGNTQQFEVTVEGDNAPAQTVAWTIVEEVTEGTSISDTGLLTVVATETLTSLTVKASSTLTGYTDKFGTATVTIINPPIVNSVTVTPATISVVKGGSATFTATVTGEHNPATTVTWSIVETDVATGTSINATTGILSIGAAEATGKEITVKATSTEDVTKSGTAKATVSADPPTVTSMSVSPATVTVINGKTQQFNAILVGDPTPPQDAVTWEVTGTNKKPATTISATGLLTIADDETATTLTVKATSTVANYTDKFATATVTVTYMFFEFGEFNDGSKTWLTNGVDNETSTLTEAILGSAKYLIIKAHADSLNGSGGLQIAHQGGTDWGWRQTDLTGNWTDIQPLASYGANIDFYIVINLSSIPDWDKTSGGGGAKLILNNPAGWTDSNFTFKKGYLTSKTLAKPATLSVDVAKDGTTYGWFAVTVPELTTELVP